MANIFVSIVGTQIMGTIHILSAFLNAHQHEECRCVLLVTNVEMIGKNAQKISSWASRNHACDVEIKKISMIVSAVDSAATVVAQIADDAKNNGDRVFFNVDGGMNYLIADCVVQLERYNPVLLQSSHLRMVSYDTKNGDLSCLTEPDLFSTREILDLQGVSWSYVSLLESSFSRFCNTHKIPLPEECLSNVLIGGMRFDLVWNPGNNRLCFLKDLRYGAITGDKLTAVRDLAGWASDRVSSCNLYDRSLYALTSNDEVAHHLESESNGKIIAYIGGDDITAFKALPDKIKKLLSSRSLTEDRYPDPIEKDADFKLENNSLIVALGTNVAPTITALRTHKPTHVVLCCTPEVMGEAEKIKVNKALYKLDTVQIVPVSIEGAYLERRLPVPGAGIRIDINITPGTKGQAAMLALWGVRHGCTVWSIDNRTNRCTPLFTSRSAKPIDILPGKLLDLDTDGASLTSSYLTSEEASLYKEILDFMELACQENCYQVFKKKVAVGGKSLEPKGATLVFTDDQGRRTTIMTTGGEWLEKLAAAALRKAGYSDVRYRLRFSWPKHLEEEILTRFPHLQGNEIFYLDLDAVGSGKEGTVVISCKSDPTFPADKAANEIASTGARIGRFTLRVLLHLGVEKSYIHKHNVMVLSWMDLCNKERLKARIQELKDKLSTTGGSYVP